MIGDRDDDKDSRSISERQQRVQREEFRSGLRALLMSPLMGPGHEEFTAVRRQAEPLREWFARETGWVLQVEREGARLYKRPADLTDATRGLPGYDRRRYVLLCLACAVLERADPQITLRLLGERLLQLAAEPALATLNFSFTLATQQERRELVAVCRTLLEFSVLQRVAGDEDAFVQAAGGEQADALYDVLRRALAGVLAAVRGPSSWNPEEAPVTLEQRLHALVDEHVADSEEGRRTAVRHQIARRLLDDPVVYIDTLDAEARSYFVNQRGAMAARLCEAAGLLAEQRAHQQEAADDLKKCQHQLITARNEAEEAAARLEVLRDAVGAKVEELQRQLAEARQAVASGEQGFRLASEALGKAGEARAVAGAQAMTASASLQERSAARAQAVAQLQRFAGTGLLAATMPHAELPDIASPWTIDPALSLARRIEQALADLKDDDETWGRVQRQLTEELSELQRALGALGHQATAELSDWGIIVHIIYQNRPERPDRLAARLAEEIAQRSELLTAKERAVLENHLQAEIAAEIQRLLVAAERQLVAINKELHKRPTSTGVRYRLQWQPLAEEEGAPVGLDAARKRLLNTSADLWSADDRRVVGTMLQQRIAAEREQADLSGGRDGSLLDQLARALDYRRWHRFRVERWQDGHWRKLSGPASSGERALGLTVPLFAAVASFYSQGSYPLAPRLILLDEAFAGIDDAARAHCMGLIREFDLDFVITSEREWGCYAELPGVAICQLQRREGIDAIFVSRWSWDGRAKMREADPDRRFAPA